MRHGCLYRDGNISEPHCSVGELLSSGRSWKHKPGEQQEKNFLLTFSRAAYMTGDKTPGPFLLTSSKFLTLRHGCRGIVRSVLSSNMPRSSTARLTAGGCMQTDPSFYRQHEAAERLRSFCGDFPSLRSSGLFTEQGQASK
mgnify:FL=1